MRPTIRQLEYFVAVADEGRFSRAAERCYVTQPGLSAQIRELESALDVTLFERDRRAVLLTQAGRGLLGRARSILLETDHLVEAARSFARPLEGPLHIGVIPTVAPYLLPRALPALHERYPALRVFLHERRTDDIVERLLAGELDVLVLALDASLPKLESAALLDDEFLLAVPDGHRLARRKTVREADLGGEAVLLLDDGHCLRDQALAVCSQGGADEVDDFRASSLSTLVQMVASGAGVTLLPAMAAETERRGRNLSLVRFRRPRPRRTIALAWRPTSPRSEEFRALAAALAASS